MRLTSIIGFAVVALASATTVEAQFVAREFRVTPRFGYIRFDEATSIENAPHVGLSTDFAITKNFAIGLTLGSSQPETRAEDFLRAQRFGDTTYVYGVKQSLSVLDYGARALAALPEMGRIAPFAHGGAGFYTIYLDPQISGGPSRVTKTMYSIGGGANLRLGGSAGVTFDVRDMIFSGYNRDRLYQATPSDFAFGEDFPRAATTKRTTHNLVFSVGFSFTPRLPDAGGDTDAGDDQ
jgi:hypothetical protein